MVSDQESQQDPSSNERVQVDYVWGPGGCVAWTSFFPIVLIWFFFGKAVPKYIENPVSLPLFPLILLGLIFGYFTLLGFGRIASGIWVARKIIRQNGVVRFHFYFRPSAEYRVSDIVRAEWFTAPFWESHFTLLGDIQPRRRTTKNIRLRLAEGGTVLLNGDMFDPDEIFDCPVVDLG